MSYVLNEVKKDDTACAENRGFFHAAEFVEENEKIWVADQGDGTYKNPVLYADYADPDAIRVGEDYYLVASSFCNTPAIPVLHSKDLVNWKVINYVMDRIPFNRYDTPVHGGGVWAPSIRYFQGEYYVFIPLSDEGIWMCKTTDPRGEWSDPVCVKNVTGWIDPCPFWDEDGKAYVVNAFAKSRIGINGRLYLSSMKPDGSCILDDGEFIFDGRKTQPVIEGPKLYKRNGYYYIFAPAGGVDRGWQTVLRSRNIYGPYEEKIVLHQGKTSVNGPHQGAWVDTPSGENWFLHFQDAGNAGRVLHLQPMRWEEDWPIIGVNEEKGCGEPVMKYRKPDVGAEYPIGVPDDSDFFAGQQLGLQWQWNANYRAEWYDLTGRGLRLYAQSVGSDSQLCDISNLLLQKWTAPEFQITTCLHLENMKDGDVTGLVSLGGHYTSVLVKKENGNLYLQQRIGDLQENNEVRIPLREFASEIIYMRMKVRETGKISFEVSCNGVCFEGAGTMEKATPGRWVGVKAGLVAINESKNAGGYVCVDFFVIHK